MVLPPLALILFSLATLAFSDLSPGPKPFCSSKSIPRQLPITIDEIFTVDLSNYFVGYNLDYTQLNAKPFAYIKPNFYSQGTAPIDVQKIISSKISLEKNSFGNVYSLLAEEGNETVLVIGNLRHPTGVPILEEPIVIETDPNVACFDS